MFFLANHDPTATRITVRYSYGITLGVGRSEPRAAGSNPN
jgi:hypothetical protein